MTSAANSHNGAAMHAQRALIRKHRHLALALLALAFAVKALIPAGFMVAPAASTVLTISICADASGTAHDMQVVVPGKSGGSDAGKKQGACAFSGLAKAAASGADAFLLALAFAFILVLGRAPAPRPPFAAIAHLRPPLRGPPAAA